MILAALPILFFGLSLLFFGATNEWRIAVLKAAVVWGLLVVANTEVLSLRALLSVAWLAAAWTLECGAMAFCVWRCRDRLLRLARGGLHWHAGLAFALAPVVVIVAATGLIAWVAPPNTWDSMTYHLAKVAHWVADASVANYPTNILWQLFYAPFSEYAALQFQVLSGGDHLANFVQWFSMVGSVAGASLIARQLGAPPRGQLLAAIVVATLPMGILQASSTQTDYVITFWLVCCVSFALTFIERSTLPTAAWFGSSLGLALLTKGNAYLFAAPLVLLLGIWMVTRMRTRLIAPGLLMVAIPLLINAGFYVRNQVLFGNPLAANQPLAAVMINARVTPQTVLSNAVRDAILQFGTPDARINHWLELAVTKLHTRLLHIGLNDPGTTYPAGFAVNALSFNEDYAGDPLQALLAIAAVLVAIGFAFRRGPPLLALYAGALVLGFLAFAAYLKWQPWHSRLELPLLVLAAPLIGALVSRISNGAVTGVLAAGLLVASIPWVIDNQTRPLIGFRPPTPVELQVRSLGEGQTIFNTSRTELYFVENKALEAPYVAAVARATRTNCTEIGLWSGFDDWEYPLWALSNPSGRQIRIDQVFVDNPSIRASRFGSDPCLVVALVPGQPATFELDGVVFTRDSSQDAVGIYAPQP